MKKTLAGTLLLAFLLSLTSCQAEVHWFGQSTYVPWYVVVIPSVIFVAICLLIAHLVIIRSTFRCPKCGVTFKPGKLEIRTWLHMGNSRVAKCPKCGFTGFCEHHKEDA